MLVLIFTAVFVVIPVHCGPQDGEVPYWWMESDSPLNSGNEPVNRQYAEGEGSDPGGYREQVKQANGNRGQNGGGGFQDDNVIGNGPGGSSGISSPQGSCPVVPRSDNCRRGRKPNCWSLGMPDVDCIGNALCCYDGCVNSCLYSDVSPDGGGAPRPANDQQSGVLAGSNFPSRKNNQPGKQRPKPVRPSNGNNPGRKNANPNQSSTAAGAASQNRPVRPKPQRPNRKRPNVQRPNNQRPTGQRPNAQKPAAQRPNVQRPAAQRPSVQRPAAQRPNVQRPAAQRPSTQNGGARTPQFFSCQHGEECVSVNQCSRNDQSAATALASAATKSKPKRRYRNAEEFCAPGKVCCPSISRPLAANNIQTECPARTRCVPSNQCTQRELDADPVPCMNQQTLQFDMCCETQEDDSSVAAGGLPSQVKPEEPVNSKFCPPVPDYQPDCKGSISTCWKVGEPDEDCSGTALCCDNGCSNMCYFGNDDQFFTASQAQAQSQKPAGPNQEEGSSLLPAVVGPPRKPAFKTNKQNNDGRNKNKPKVNVNESGVNANSVPNNKKRLPPRNQNQNNNKRKQANQNNRRKVANQNGRRNQAAQNNRRNQNNQASNNNNFGQAESSGSLAASASQSANEDCVEQAGKSDEECAGQVGACWSPGQPDRDCPNNALCYYDGCANRCCGSPPLFGSSNNAGASGIVPAEQKPFTKCPAAMLCHPRINCDFDGFITEIEMNVSPELEMLRVPLIPCVNPKNLNIDVCCRDPNYVDPWPNGMDMKKRNGRRKNKG